MILALVLTNRDLKNEIGKVCDTEPVRLFDSLMVLQNYFGNDALVSRAFLIFMN